MRLFRLTQDWVEDQATWTQRATGLAWGSAGADGATSNAGVELTGDCTTTGQRLFDMTRFVQEWSSGAPNYGIVMTDSGVDGIDLSSSESTTSPVLTVMYKPSQTPVATQALSGVTADVSFSSDVPLGQTYFWNVQVTDAIGQQSWAPVDFQLTADATAPHEPVLVLPVNEATAVDVSATLSATVSDPSGGPLNVSLSLRRAAAPEFTIIAMPDTQFYSESYPAIFTSQTQWIIDKKAERNIVFVTHEGDIVNQNTTTQWQRANTSLSMLDGIVPYGMGPGNHDQPTTMFNQYFPYTRYQSEPWYGGHYQNLNDNNFQLFSAGGLDFVIVHLTFCPPAASRHVGRFGVQELSRPHRHHDDPRLSQRVGAAHGTWLHEHAVFVGRACGAESEPALHVERARPRRVATQRCRQRPSGVPDAGRLSGSRQRRRRLAADSAIRPCREQDLRADVLARG